jgi:hypothetical protein
VTAPVYRIDVSYDPITSTWQAQAHTVADGRYVKGSTALGESAADAAVNCCDHLKAIRAPASWYADADAELIFDVIEPQSLKA